eukprot:Ihof_evm3s12 gene=Ihof_evmTU3s12
MEPTATVIALTSEEAEISEECNKQGSETATDEGLGGKPGDEVLLIAEPMRNEHDIDDNGIQAQLLQSLQQQNQTLQLALDAAETRENDFKTREHQLQTESEGLKLEIANERENAAQLKQNYEKLKVERLVQEEAWQEIQNSLTNGLERIAREVQERKDENAALVSDLENQKREFTEREEREKILQLEYERMKEDMIMMEGKARDCTLEYEGMVEKLHRTIRDLEGEVERSNKELEQFELKVTNQKIGLVQKDKKDQGTQSLESLEREKEEKLKIERECECDQLRKEVSDLSAQVSNYKENLKDHSIYEVEIKDVEVEATEKHKEEKEESERDNKESIAVERKNSCEWSDKLAALQIQLDGANELNEQRANECALLKERCEQAHQKLEECTNEMRSAHDNVKENEMKMAKQIQKLKDVESEKQELKTQIENFTEQVLKGQEVQRQIPDLEIQIKDLQMEIEMLRNQLSNEIKEHENTKQSLSLASATASNTGVLSLELSDYKRAVDNMKKQLETKTAECTQLQAQLKDFDSNHSKIAKLKSLVRTARKETAESKILVEEGQKEIAALTTNYEKATVALETQRTLVFTLQSQIQELQNKQSLLQRALTNQISESRAEIDQLTAKFATTNAAYLDCQEEFKKYKIRAKSVLKQRNDSGTVVPVVMGPASNALVSQLALIQSTMEEHERIKNENVELLLAIEKEKSQVLALKEKLHMMTEENDYLCKEANGKQGLSTTIQSLTNQLQVREMERASLLEQLDQVQDRLTQASQSNVQIVGLDLKKQIEEKEKEQHRVNSKLKEVQDTLIRTTREKNELEQQLDETKQANKTLRAQQDLQRLNGGNSMSYNPRSSNNPEDLLFNVVSPHESESSNQTLDLSKLLNSEDPSVSSQVPSRNNSSLNFLAPQTSVSHMDSVQEVLAAHKQMSHVRELLKESEGHNMRLEEQQRVLKEEVRRLERNLKRESGINLEYLKNILFKFLDAEQEQERLPLLQ